MARLAQRLQVVGRVRSTLGQRPYVIHFRRHHHPPLSFALNAERIASEEGRAYLLPSLVVAA